MKKKLAKHGHSYAILIEKSILDLLGITPETDLEVKTNGRDLIIRQPRKKRDVKKKANDGAVNNG